MPSEKEPKTLPTNEDDASYTRSAGELLADLLDKTHPPIKPVQQEVSTQDSTLIPAEIRTTRDAGKIADYLDGKLAYNEQGQLVKSDAPQEAVGTDHQKLNKKAREQLISRMANLAYYDRLEEKFRKYTEANSYSGYQGNVHELMDYLRMKPDMKRPNIDKPFARSKMDMRVYVNSTGNPNVIADYLDTEPVTDATKKPLSDAARRHLIDRMVNSIYIDKQAEKFKDRKYEPLPAKKLENGCVLQGIHQNEWQHTWHCCWTMPVKLMLQSRGIDLDQETLRCAKPDLSHEFLENMISEYKKKFPNNKSINAFDVENIKSYTKNMDGFSYNLASLVHKFVPNCAMAQSSYIVTPMTPPEEKETMKAVFQQKVTTALSEHRSPVALNYKGHYRTIVGIDGDDLILKNSLSHHLPDTNYKVSIKSLFKVGSSIDMFYLKDLSVTKSDVLPEELAGVNDDPEKKKVEVIPSGPDQGKLVINDEESQNHQYLSLGASKALLVSKSVPGSKYKDSEVLYLPEKLNDKAITLQLPQEVKEQEEVSEQVENAPRAVSSSKSFAVSERIAQEDSFLTELSDSNYKRILDMGNEARNDLRRYCAAAEGESAEAKAYREGMIRNCMHTMLYAKRVEAERVMSGGKPGAVELAFTSSANMDELLQNDQLKELYAQCPDPAKMSVENAEDFILNDTAGKLVRGDLLHKLENNQKLSPASRDAARAKIINGTDPLHETQRLEMLYHKLKDADPALMRSSPQFRKMRKDLETVIKLRGKRRDISDKTLPAEERLAEATALTRAYVDLDKSARAYMSIKSPALLRSGTTAMARYNVAGALLDFAGEMKQSYVKTAASLPRQPQADAAQASMAPKSAKL